MASSATEITLKHRKLLDPESQSLLDWGRNNGGVASIRFTESVEDSIALNNIRHGAIIISASGMCNAGRIKQHLKFNLPRAECTVIIAGFQAQGTLGRKLVDHVSPVRIYQESVPVRADIYTLGGLSAHADQAALMAWLKHFQKPPRKTFVVHGEEETALGFGMLIHKALGWTVEVPTAGAMVEL
jgi:metallo-beta-lactamase family protein